MPMPVAANGTTHADMLSEPASVPTKRVQPGYAYRAVAHAGNIFALSLIHLVGVLWWVFVSATIFGSYAHSLIKPPRPHDAA